MRKIALTVVAAVVATLGTIPAAQAQSTYEWESRPGDTRVCIDSREVNDRKWRVGRAKRQWNRALPADSVELRRNCRGPRQIRLDSAWRPTHDDHGGWASAMIGGDGWISGVSVLFNRSVVRDMTWRRGCYRRYVTAHELGHALGLPHSPHRHSVMSGAGWYETCGKVTWRDRRAVRRLYR